MKYAFLVTIAAFAFLISCGKKDKKQGQAGKTAAATQVCKDKVKEKDTEACKALAEKERLAAEKGQVSGDGDRVASGAKDPKSEYSTIPNLDDEVLKDKAVMPITLNDQTALLAEMKINSESENPTATKLFCGDIADTEKLQKEAALADPDELKNAITNIYLFGKATIVADLKVNNGDSTGGKTKLFMLTCNSNSKTTAESYKNEKTIETRVLKSGQQAFEYVAYAGKDEVGILVSFDCNADDTLLNSKVKTINGKEKTNKSLNRIRLRKGSSVLVRRAVDYKEGDKKLSELGSDKQKENKLSIISCNS